ncbi:MAG TPA: DinB family protein [Tepidisphaeraceae bacterium]|nr:DinB family protein [Tepidisphaeraceae bacterium]
MADAFSGRPDMSLLASLNGITQQEASWQPDASTPSIEQLVRHIAWSKSRFCERGFGRPMILVDPAVNDDGDSAELAWEFPCGAAWGCQREPGIGAAVRLLEQSQQTFADCLNACSHEALEQPIPTHHGKSAANFFSIMLMHDLYHAGQIRTRRTLYVSSRRPTVNAS